MYSNIKKYLTFKDEKSGISKAGFNEVLFFFLLYRLHVLFLFFFFFMNSEINITGEDYHLLQDCSSIKRRINGDIY